MSIIRNITIKAYDYLYKDEIMLFIGARQAGKTTILKQLQNFLLSKNENTYFLNLEDPEYLSLLNESPKNLFRIFPLDISNKNKKFVFIDEIQYLKNPSNFLKFFYDEYKEKIKLIVSGSSAFYLDEKFKDSLTGRKKIFEVLTLSFREFLRFKNEPELAQKNFNNLSLSEKEKVSFLWREYIIYGGYPRVVLAPISEKEELLKEIAYSYIKKDVFESKVRKEETFYKLFKILASQIGNLVNSSELASILTVSKTVIDTYIFVMQKSFHGALVKPFYKNIRKELVKMPKFYFLDCGLRNFFAGNLKPFDQREDRGQLLENIVFRQLLERYDLNDIKFWRTVQKHEIDFILEEDKTAIEVKVNPSQFKEKNYKKFIENYPDFSLIIACLDQEGYNNSRKIISAWKL